MNSSIGKLVVVTGFSGAGKDTLINLFLQKRSDFEVVVTHSTRPPRPGEIPGVHHHFVKQKEFKMLIQRGEMLEYVKYGSFYKGTSKTEFTKIMTGKNLIWRVDILRAVLYEDTFLNVYGEKTAQQLISNSLKIFIKAQSHKIAQRRYLIREKGKGNLNEYQKRLKRDIELFNKYKNVFPNVILNRSGKSEESAEEMERIIDFYLHLKE
jgi:guanylate kinase